MIDGPLPAIDASTVSVVASESDDASSLAKKLPNASDVPAQAIVMICDRPESRSRMRLFARFASRAPAVSRHVRANALLARGFAEIAAAYDERTRVDCVWGVATGSG